MGLLGWLEHRGRTPKKKGLRRERGLKSYLKFPLNLGPNTKLHMCRERTYGVWEHAGPGGCEPSGSSGVCIGWAGIGVLMSEWEIIIECSRQWVKTPAMPTLVSRAKQALK